MSVLNGKSFVANRSRFGIYKMLLQILFIALSGLIYYFLFRRNSDYWKKRDVVQESSFTALGPILKLFLGDRSLPEMIKDIYDKHPTEPYVGLLWGSKPALLLRDPELVQHVFTTDFQSFHSRGFVTNPEDDKLADNILFMEDYPKWKLIRQKLSPVFTSSRLKNMFYILEHSSRDFARFVEQNQNVYKNPFDLLYTYTTASIGSAVFGIDTRAQNTMNSPFLEMSTQSVAPSFINNVRFFVGTSCATLYKFLKIKIFGDHENFFIGVVKNVLKERKTEKVRRHDFIDICTELQKNGVMKDSTTGIEVEPSDELLAAQAYFFFIAGADTSANTMNFTLMELAQNVDILSRLHKEIDEVYSDSNILSYEDVDKLHYLDMVINEAMRKYPPIGILQRKCAKTTILPVGNLKIEKGVMMIIPVFGLHRDEKHYPKPEVYDPERFCGDTMKNKYTFLPFGEGNRVCIGKACFINLIRK